MIVEEATEKQSNRIDAFDTARGCAVVLVVFMHVTQQLQTVSPLPATLMAFNWSAASIRMPLLFTLSGFLAQRYRTRGNRYIAYRTAHFVWLIIVWGLISAIIRIGQYVNYSVLSSLGYTVLLPQSPLWFVWALAVFTSSIRIVTRWSRSSVVMVALIIGCLSYLPPFHTTLPDLPVLKTARHAIFFYIGLMYADVIVDLIFAKRGHTIVLLAGSAAVLHTANTFTDRMIHASVLLIPEKLTLSLLALTICAKMPQMRITCGAQWLGRNTLPIFLGHMLFVNLLIGLHINVGLLGLPFAITLCSVAASIYLKRFLDVAGLGWMYRLPINIELVGALTSSFHVKRQKLLALSAARTISLRIRDRS